VTNAAIVLRQRAEKRHFDHEKKVNVRAFDWSLLQRHVEHTTQVTGKQRQRPGHIEIVSHQFGAPRQRGVRQNREQTEQLKWPLEVV
jgi:hypothetical protein